MLTTSSQKILGYVALGVSSLIVVTASQMSQAQAATFTGLSGNLAASADFQFNGDKLTVTLTNTSAIGVQAQGDLLTGLFFKTPQNLTLASVSLGSGSKVYQNGAVASTQPTNLKVDKSGNTITGLTGGWQYKSSISNTTLGSGTFQGVGTAGFSSSGSGSGIFDGNATGGQGNQQFNYGLLGAGGFAANANSQVTGSSQTIKNSLVFNFTGATGLTDASISNVLFQYGTALNESRFAGNLYTPPAPQPKKVPEPAATTSLGLFAIGTLKLLKKKREM